MPAAETLGCVCMPAPIMSYTLLVAHGRHIFVWRQRSSPEQALHPGVLAYGCTNHVIHPACCAWQAHCCLASAALQRAWGACARHSACFRQRLPHVPATVHSALMQPGRCRFACCQWSPGSCRSTLRQALPCRSPSDSPSEGPLPTEVSIGSMQTEALQQQSDTPPALEEDSISPATAENLRSASNDS